MKLRIHRLSLQEARAKVEAIDMMDDVAFEDLVRRWTSYEVDEGSYNVSYQELRGSLIECFQLALAKTDGKMTYLLDLYVGIRLYELLSPQDGFTNVIANDDGFWRYLSVCVMPDITYLRYPDPKKGDTRINQKRFYAHTRRIWLKTLWWYVHLSWQGSAMKTFQVLQNNGTNIISHFIERPGRGYRLNLFRNIMLAYSLQPVQKDKVFRAAAKMNLAKCISVEPALTLNGEYGYAAGLFNEILQAEVMRNAD